MNRCPGCGGNDFSVNVVAQKDLSAQFDDDGMLRVERPDPDDERIYGVECRNCCRIIRMDELRPSVSIIFDSGAWNWGEDSPDGSP